MTSDRKLGWMAWIVVCVVWGTTYLAIRVALETVPVFLLAGLRWMAAGMLLTGALAMAGRRLPGPATWGSIALLAFLMNVIGNGLVVWAEQYVTSGLTAVIVAMVPFWSVFVEACLPTGERIGRQALAGLTLGFAGILVLVWPELTMGGSEGRALVWGIVALQVACAGWAAGTSYTKRHTQNVDPMSSSGMQMLFSGVMLLAAATVRGEWTDLAFSNRTLFAMVYLTLIGSIVGYTAYIYALKHLPISTVSLYAYVNPIIAVALGTWLLSEPITLRMAVAAILVVAGIALVRGVQSKGAQTPATRRAHA